jgi:hypothetical protein
MASGKVAKQKSFKLIQLWSELKYPKRQSGQVFLVAVQSNFAGGKTFHYGPIKGLCSLLYAHNWIIEGRFATIWVELQRPFGYNTTNNSQTGGFIEALRLN